MPLHEMVCRAWRLLDSMYAAGDISDDDWGTLNEAISRVEIMRRVNLEAGPVVFVGNTLP